MKKEELENKLDKCLRDIARMDVEIDENRRLIDNLGKVVLKPKFKKGDKVICEINTDWVNLREVWKTYECIIICSTWIDEWTYQVKLANSDRVYSVINEYRIKKVND